MLESQKILRSMSEKRQELHTKRKQFDALADDVSPERRGEVAGEMGQIADDLSGLEPTYRTAVDAESQAIDDARRSGDREQPSAEAREYLEIESQAKLRGFLDQAIYGNQIKGAEAELRSAIFEHQGKYDDIIPWAMWLEPEKLKEIRTAFAPGTTLAAIQDPIIQAVFAASTAAFLMTRFESAPVGNALEFVLTSTGATAVSAGAGHTATGSLTAKTLVPRRVTTKYEVGTEHMYQVVGLESALRADIPRSIMDALDSQVINGGAAPSFPGGILNNFTITAATTTVSFANGLGTLAAAIDGQYARDLNELKMVVGAETIARLRRLVQSNTAVSLADYLKMNSGGLMATSNIPAAVSNDQEAIICKTGPGMQGNAVGKMWGGGIQVIRDEKSDAATGVVNITGRIHADYAVLRTAGFVGVSFQLA